MGPIKPYCKHLLQELLSHYQFIYFFFICPGFLLISSQSYAQQNFRRHFIIAYDVSPPFINAEKRCDSYKRALVGLFTNKPVFGYNDANQNNLQIEKKNGVLFFDKLRDEISFYHFNISAQEIDRLRWAAGNYDASGIVSEFNRLFIKDKKFSWRDFSQQGNATINNYLEQALSIRPSPAAFASGVSMSNFVYPLVLKHIDTTSYAEEYVLVILSDFLTGSMLGNTKDLERVRDIFRVSYGTLLPDHSPVSYIKKDIDDLAAHYYKIDFFQYSFMPDFSTNAIGIIAGKIKPKIGVLSPEDVALFVDGNLTLDQTGYRDPVFRTSQTKIKFTHNKNLLPVELKLTVSLPSKNKILFDDVVATRNEQEEWSSAYSSNSELMNFDSVNLSYTISPLRIPMDSAINDRNFKNLKFRYQFKARYGFSNARPLNLLYVTERDLPIENINYSTKASIIIMYYLLPALLFTGLIFFLAYYGKPRKLLFTIDGYLDSFEVIDYSTVGKLIAPYKAWDSQTPQDYLIVHGQVLFKSDRFLFNWRSPVYLTLAQAEAPPGFDLFLKQDTGDLREFGTDSVLVVRKDRNNRFMFAVGLRQNDVNKKITEQVPVKFKLGMTVKDSFLFIRSDIRKTVEYNFYIGPDLGDVWVGFDPGTTGSCVAVGSSPGNIILGKDSAKKDIIPSALVFEKTLDYHPNGAEIPESLYKYGSAADGVFDTISRYVGFKSIKKLLGFKDVKEITFQNNKRLELKGKDLAGILVKGLYKEANSFFSKDIADNREYHRNGKFNPLRAVVAIPNNFTITKIQEMIDCIRRLNQFKEIRYVYEAEAVLFYYLSKFREYNPGDNASDSENILVFDMGGATINATIVTTNKVLENNRTKYEIDFLGKIGYGIGGDTIDYCISRFLLSFTDEFPQLARFDIMEDKLALSRMALEIKKEISRNYYKKEPYLITAFNLETFINAALKSSISIDEETSKMYGYFKKSNGKFALFAHPIFVNTIYANVEDAVREVNELSKNVHIDKIIFSGRTTAFPMIKEIAENLVKQKNPEVKSIALGLEESKTAVARGACWYGINKNSIVLNNLKTSAAFGFKKTLSSDISDVRFYELVGMGYTFNSSNDTIDAYDGIKDIKDDFGFDGSKVNFFQVMGKNVDGILSADQKHKYSKIATIRIDQLTEKVGMKVNENDIVDCIVVLQSQRKLRETGLVADQEIDEANEEHYTWMVK